MCVLFSMRGVDGKGGDWKFCCYCCCCWCWFVTVLPNFYWPRSAASGPRLQRLCTWRPPPPSCPGYPVGTKAGPNKINAPPKLSRVKGESGRFWEDKFVGYNIEAFFDPADPLKEKQAGKLWADKKQSRVAPADQNLVDHA